jgi:hypothetical protein
MAEYRAYTVRLDGHFIRYRAYVCADDAEAIIWAKQLVDGHAVEVWNGDRFVSRLEPERPK